MSLTALEKGPRNLKFEADEGERAALAARFDLLEITKFTGEATVTPGKGDAGYVVAGQFRAKLSQSCGITLEPVWDVLRESFEVRLVSPPEDGAELDQDPEDEEDIETLEGEDIDIGEIAVQYLGTALNPYPRKEGHDAGDLTFEGGEVVSEEKARELANPFSLLKKLRDRG